MTRRYTDTSLTFLVKNRDLRNASHVYVTFSQHIPEDLTPDDIGSLYNIAGGNHTVETITIEASNITYSSPNSLVIIDLSQAQTSNFQEGFVRVQVNWLDSSGKRKATVTKKIKHRPNLCEEVLP